MQNNLFTSINVLKCQRVCMHGCMYICTSVHVCVCVSVCKHDLMQHGIPNTSGALSIFFLARTSCSPERFRCYMTFMRLPWASVRVAQTTDTASPPWQQNAKYCHNRNASGRLPTWRQRLSRRSRKNKVKNLKKSLFLVDKNRGREWDFKRGDWIQKQTGRESSFPRASRYRCLHL